MRYGFAGCVLDIAGHRLERDGAEVHVEPQVFALLQLLAEAGGDLVTRDRIMEVVWDGRIVSEATVSARINAARVAVGDDGARQAVIRTVPRRGLRMVAEVTRDGARSVAGASRQTLRMCRSADGTSIAWARSGIGPPLLRAGHWLSHLELDWESPVWRPLLDRLGSHHELIRYDQRGTGLSERECPLERLEDFVADMKAVADAAGPERFSIYAVSQSVPVAVSFAARYPERVKSMVLYAGFAEGSALRDAARGERHTDTFVDLIRTGWGQAGSPFMAAFSALFMPDATREQLDSFIAMQLQSISPENAVALRRAISRFDVRDVLGEVRCPVLVCHGRRDGVQPFEEGQKLARGIPDARLVALDTANHVSLPHDKGWHGLMDESEAFLAEVGG